MPNDKFNEKVLNNKFDENFILRERKLMILAYWFVILYIWYKLGKILEEYCCNGVCIFCGVTIGVYEGWCNASAGLIAIWTDGRATSEPVGGVTGGTDGRFAGGAVNKATGRAVGRVTSGAAGKIANKAAGEVASKVADRAIDRVASGTTSEITGRVTDRTIDGATGRAASEAAGRVTSRATSRATSKAASGAIGKAAGRIGTIGVWIDVTIILTNSLVYVFKLEKLRKQPGSSSYCNCLTNVI